MSKISNKRADYDIGYRKPPKTTQFKKGQSGNPRGRRKKKTAEMPDVKSALITVLNQKVAINENGAIKHVSKLELIVMQLVTKAANGSVAQLRLLVPILVKFGEGQGAAGGNGASSQELQKELDALLAFIGLDDVSLGEAAVREDVGADTDTGFDEGPGAAEPSH